MAASEIGSKIEIGRGKKRLLNAIDRSTALRSGSTESSNNENDLISPSLQ
jgi:hypothetical protein